jgi:hypothetical protein
MSNLTHTKNIPGNTTEVHSCPLVSWYKFKQCGIQTCKNYNKVTATKCLDIDRVKVDGTKFISDSELHLFKYSKKKKSVTTRFVSLRRKQAVDRVKSILILRKYLDYLQQKYEKASKVTKAGIFIEKLESEYPLNVKKLGFKNWMWVYLIREEEYEKFLKANPGECKEFGLDKLLCLTELKYEKLLNEIRGK